MKLFCLLKSFGLISGFPEYTEVNICQQGVACTFPHMYFPKAL